MSIAESININVEFRGGAELLFGGIKEQKISLPQNVTPWTIKSLLCWLKDNLLKQSPDLFIRGNSVRPGILVIVNETDWELLGELDYVLKNDDRVLFISTLHGG